MLGDQDLRERQVEGTRDLQGSFVARDHMHGPTDRLDEAGEARLTGVPGGVRLTCVLFHIRSTDGVTCIGQKILSNETEYDSSLALFVTWKGDRWVITGGSVDRVNKQ